jgi:hypothetical protein
MRVSGKVLLLAEDHERVALMSFRNLDHVIACNAGQANTYDVLWADTVIMSRGTLDLGQSSPRGSTRAVSADHDPASSTEYPVARPDADVDGAPRAEHADATESAPEMAASDDGGGA